MKEKSIIFNTEMVKAILEGRKTQTRRVIKPQPIFEGKQVELKDVICFGYQWKDTARGYCPFGKVGERLWVREAIRKSNIVHPEYGHRIEYVADDYRHPDANWVWKKDYLPAMFMPYGLSRITLEITDIKVERVQEISCDDCYSEGFEEDTCENCCGAGVSKCHCIGETEKFKWGWNSIYGKDAWDKNEFVWVIEFRR